MTPPFFCFISFSKARASVAGTLGTLALRALRTTLTLALRTLVHTVLLVLEHLSVLLLLLGIEDGVVLGSLGFLVGAILLHHSFAVKVLLLTGFTLGAHFSATDRILSGILGGDFENGGLLVGFQRYCFVDTLHFSFSDLRDSHHLTLALTLRTTLTLRTALILGHSCT